MVYNKNYDSEDSDSSLVYDLRTIYAKEIVGETLKNIKVARLTENYPAWYKLLKRDLYTEINHKLEPEEKLKIRKTIKEIKTIISKNNLAYLGKSKDSEEHELVEDSLAKLERLLLRLMEKHKMFGSKEDDEGL